MPRQRSAGKRWPSRCSAATPSDRSSAVLPSGTARLRTAARVPAARDSTQWWKVVPWDHLDKSCNVGISAHREHQKMPEKMGCISPFFAGEASRGFLRAVHVTTAQCNLRGADVSRLGNLPVEHASSQAEPSTSRVEARSAPVPSPLTDAKRRLACGRQ